jgi:hypothetical protein
LIIYLLTNHPNKLSPAYIKITYPVYFNGTMFPFFACEYPQYKSPAGIERTPTEINPSKAYANVPLSHS